MPFPKAHTAMDHASDTIGTAVLVLEGRHGLITELTGEIGVVRSFQSEDALQVRDAEWFGSPFIGRFQDFVDFVDLFDLRRNT